MERYDDHSIFEKSDTMKISVMKSLRFKMLLSVLIILLFCGIMAASFTNMNHNLLNEMQRLTSMQADYYSGYGVLEPLHQNLNSYLKLNSEEYLEYYEQCQEEFTMFIERLSSEDWGPYAVDMTFLCEKYIMAADRAVQAVQKNETDEMVEAVTEASHIKELISSLSMYTSRDIGNMVNDSFAELNGSSKIQLRTISVFLMVGVFAVMVCVFWFIRRLFTPLGKLIALVQKVSMRSWEIQPLPERIRDEMELLNFTFYLMMNENSKQFSELLQKRKLEKELQKEREQRLKSEALAARSELKAYQSQINSHFLFNTLNCILHIAEVENAPQVVEALGKLSRFLRNILSQFNSTITLTEEFSNIENYINIQKIRFRDRIQVEESLDMDLEWFYIPAMTLQPLIENAFSHGLAQRKNGFIKYAAEKYDHYIFLYVWDDGSGIAAQRQREILDCLYIQNIDQMLHENIGYQNVFRRLDLLYPGCVVPFLDSQEGAYTKIGFKIYGSAEEAERAGDSGESCRSDGVCIRGSKFECGKSDMGKDFFVCRSDRGR